MKKMFLSVLGLALVLSVTGCGSPTGDGRIVIRSFTLWNPNLPPSYLDGVDVPANPVRRSETIITSLDGSYSYYHSQGTCNNASRSWGPYGPMDNVSQSTYNSTSENYTPLPRFIPPMVAPPVYPAPPAYTPSPAYPRQNRQQQDEKPPCPSGTIQMRPNE